MGDAIIRYYYRKDPDKLSDKQYAKIIAEWQFIQDLEQFKKSNLLKDVLNEVLYKLVNEYIKATVPKKKR